MTTAAPVSESSVDQAPPSLPLPEGRRWRCTQCGNLTRFDVVRSQEVREFWHFDLAGEPVVEESEVRREDVERVQCRWCSSTAVETVPRPGPTAE